MCSSDLSISARNFNDAKDRFIQKYTFEDDDILDDWCDFVKYMEENRGIVLGEFYELSEF